MVNCNDKAVTMSQLVESFETVQQTGIAMVIGAHGEGEGGIQERVEKLVFVNCIRTSLVPKHSEIVTFLLAVSYQWGILLENYILSS